VNAHLHLHPTAVSVCGSFILAWLMAGWLGVAACGAALAVGFLLGERHVITVGLGLLVTAGVATLALGSFEASLSYATDRRQAATLAGLGVAVIVTGALITSPGPGARNVSTRNEEATRYKAMLLPALLGIGVALAVWLSPGASTPDSIRQGADSLVDGAVLTEALRPLPVDAQRSFAGVVIDAYSPISNRLIVALLLGVGASLFAAVVSRPRGNRARALTAVALVALVTTPPLVFGELPDIVALGLTLLAIVALHSDCRFRGTLAGVALALASLARPEALVVVVFAVVGAIRQKHLGDALQLLVISMVGALPWLTWLSKELDVGLFAGMSPLRVMMLCLPLIVAHIAVVPFRRSRARLESR
jgi:hypothetical protein